MPKAAIHEYSHPSGRENNVGADPPTVCLDRIVDSKSQSPPMELGSKPALGNSAGATIRPHAC